MAVTINPLVCPQNHRCPIIKKCPLGAISQDGNGLPIIDETKCAECMECANYCPMRAVQMN